LFANKQQNRVCLLTLVTSSFIVIVHLFSNKQVYDFDKNNQYFLELPEDVRALSEHFREVFWSKIMLLQDSIRINASADEVFDFFNGMAQNYTRWHPDHRLFRWLNGDSVAVGTIFYFEEIIAGHLQKKSVRFINVHPGRFMEFEPMNWFVRILMPRLSFAMEPMGADSCNFVAKIHLRVGPLAARLNAREFTAVRQHMRQEGENLKQLLEVNGVETASVSTLMEVQ
jgi:hypothetical protein